MIRRYKSIRPGKKADEWKQAKVRLIEEYREAGITRCEGRWFAGYDDCTPDWGLSFHHLDKRSSGKAEHTIEGTRLLCPSHHRKAEYDRLFNYQLKKLR